MKKLLPLSPPAAGHTYGRPHDTPSRFSTNADRLIPARMPPACSQDALLFIVDLIRRLIISLHSLDARRAYQKCIFPTIKAHRAHP